MKEGIRESQAEVEKIKAELPVEKYDLEQTNETSIVKAPLIKNTAELQAKIDATHHAILDTFKSEKTSDEPRKQNGLKNPNVGLPIKIYPREKPSVVQSLKNKATQLLSYLNRKKKQIAFVAALGTAGAANAQHGPNNQNEGVDPIKPKTEEPRKVSTPLETLLAQGYTIVNVEEGKTVLKKGKKGAEKPTEAQKIKRAPTLSKKITASPDKKVTHPKRPSKEENAKKDIAPDQLDMVYIENEKKADVDPYAAFAVMGMPLYETGVSGHITAQSFFADRETKSIVENGGLDTRKGKVLVKFRNDFGLTGLNVILSTDDFSKYFSHTGRATSPDALKELIGIAMRDSDKTYTLTPEDVAKGTTR